MLKSKRSLVAVLGMTAIVVGLFVVTPSASASGTKCNPGCEAQAEFRSHGEHMIVHDYEKDGHSAVALMQQYIDGVWWNVNTTSGTNGHFWNSTGFNHPPVDYNLSISERRRVRYRACKGEANWTHPNGGNTFDCSAHWRYDRA
jgi:hypothetical protein